MKKKLLSGLAIGLMLLGSTGLALAKDNDKDRDSNGVPFTQLQRQINQLQKQLDALQLSNGVKGDKGDQGIQGPIGLTGTKGDTGLTGPKGDQGVQGFPGSDGLDGAQGIAGQKGDTGNQGPIGLTGPQGEQGLKGDIGLTGAVGLNGDQGDQGIQGIQGPIGLTGEQGLIGHQGPKGDTGVQGLTGDQGSKGDKGETGPQGTQGQDGAAGVAGAPGPKGDTGTPGQTGPQGPQGSQGAPVSSYIGGMISYVPQFNYCVNREGEIRCENKSKIGVKVVDNQVVEFDIAFVSQVSQSEGGEVYLEDPLRFQIYKVASGNSPVQIEVWRGNSRMTSFNVSPGFPVRLDEFSMHNILATLNSDSLLTLMVDANQVTEILAEASGWLKQIEYIDNGVASAVKIAATIQNVGLSSATYLVAADCNSGEPVTPQSMLLNSTAIKTVYLDLGVRAALPDDCWVSLFSPGTGRRYDQIQVFTTPRVQ